MGLPRRKKASIRAGAVRTPVVLKRKLMALNEMQPEKGKAVRKGSMVIVDVKKGGRNAGNLGLVVGRRAVQGVTEFKVRPTHLEDPAHGLWLKRGKPAVWIPADALSGVAVKRRRRER